MRLVRAVLDAPSSSDFGGGVARPCIHQGSTRGEISYFGGTITGRCMASVVSAILSASMSSTEPPASEDPAWLSSPPSVRSAGAGAAASASHPVCSRSQPAGADLRSVSQPVARDVITT